MVTATKVEHLEFLALNIEWNQHNPLKNVRKPKKKHLKWNTNDVIENTTVACSSKHLSIEKKLNREEFWFCNFQLYIEIMKFF